jgi:hypothetical protein
MYPDKLDHLLLYTASDLISKAVSYCQDAGALLTARELQALEEHVLLGNVLLNETVPACEESVPVPLD